MIPAVQSIIPTAVLPAVLPLDQAEMASRGAAIDATAKAYQTTTGISKSAARRWSKFLLGLDALSIRTSLIDAVVLRADMQPTGGTTAYSLLGTSNLAMNGTITRHKNGFVFGNDSDSSPTVPSYCTGSFPVTSGDVTMIFASFRPSESNITHTHAPVMLYKPANSATPLPAWTVNSLWAQAEGSNFLAYTYDGLGNFSPFAISAHSPAETRYMPIALSNAAVGAAGSLTARIPGQTTASTTGTGSKTFNRLELGRYSDSGYGSWKNYDDSLVPFVFAFSKILSTTELAGFNALVDQYIHPKYRIVAEGDSMSSSTVGLCLFFRDRAGFFGSNMDLVEVATGGETTTQMVSEIGTAAGINDQGSSSFPVICTIWGGQNDRAIDGNQTHANLRTLWAAAKSRGMKVVAFTITKSSSITAAGWEADRLLANAAIRGDAGLGYYDYLMDVDALIAGASSYNPYYLDPAWYNQVIPDQVHLTSTIPGGNTQLMDALYTLISAEIP